MTRQHLHILQHSMGLDEYGRDSHGAVCPKETYRNRYVTEDASPPGVLCLEMVALGLMVRHAPRVVSGDMPIFCVTPAGYDYIRNNSPPAPKVSRGKARYLKWLRVRDVYPDMTFGDWLRTGADSTTAGGK